MTTPTTQAGLIEALEPCPFCGGDNIRKDVGLSEFDDGEVSCESCRGNVGNHPTLAEAIAAWNRRSSPTRSSEAGAVAEHPRCSICGRGVGHHIHTPFGETWHEYSPAQPTPAPSSVEAVTINKGRTVTVDFSDTRAAFDFFNAVQAAALAQQSLPSDAGEG